MHTNYSDGVKTVEEVIEIARIEDLDYISITDHDTLEGSIKAYNMQSKYNDIKFIIGIELSTENNDESVHILGYFKDDSFLGDFELYLENQRKQRKERAIKIKNALYEHFNIDLNMDFMDKIQSITRGTIANEIVNQGYPYSRNEIFSKMIGNGNPAYFPSTKLTTKRGIKLIHDFGGLAVLAHPVLLKKNDVEEIISFGLDGIEAIYPANRDGDEEKFRSLAKRYGLFITAGNDFHDFNDNRHGHIGNLTLDENELNIFLKKLEVL